MLKPSRFALDFYPVTDANTNSLKDTNKILWFLLLENSLSYCFLVRPRENHSGSTVALLWVRRWEESLKRCPFGVMKKHRDVAEVAECPRRAEAGTQVGSWAERSGP